MLDYPTSIYKFRDNIPERLHWNLVEIQCLRNRRHELISRIRFQKSTKCQAEKLKNQISKFNKVLKQSVKQKSSRIRFQKSTKYQNKVSKQTFHH